MRPQWCAALSSNNAPTTLTRQSLFLLLAFAFGAGFGCSVLLTARSSPRYAQYATARWGAGIFEKDLVEESVAAYAECRGLMRKFSDEQSAFVASVAEIKAASDSQKLAWKECCTFKSRECLEQQCSALFAPSPQVRRR